MQKRVLIISPYFPPSQLAGVHRARHLMKHLPDAGWTPILLCIDEHFHEQRLDPGLARLVPNTAEIVKVPAIPARFTRPFGIGDITLRALHTLRAAVIRLASTGAVDVVLITAAPYFPLLLAPMIRKRFGIPVVLDFQDPWVSSWGAAQARWSKAGLSHNLADWFEPHVLRSANWITSVSDAQNEEMAMRRPWLDRSRMSALPIGGDAEDFDAASFYVREELVQARGYDLIEFSYVGSYWPAVEPALRSLLRSLSVLRRLDPELAKRMRFNFIGTDSTSTSAQARVLPIALAEGVSDLVVETPQRLPYLQAIAAMKRSHGLLLIGSDEPHYTASKIYPALMAGRPYLSLFHARSSAHAVLRDAGGGIALSFNDASELPAIEMELAHSLRALAREPESIGDVDPRSYAAFEAHSIANAFGDIFNHVARAGDTELMPQTEKQSEATAC